MTTALRFNKRMHSMEVEELRANLPEPPLTRKDLLPHVEFASPVQDDRSGIAKQRRQTQAVAETPAQTSLYAVPTGEAYISTQLMLDVLASMSYALARVCGYWPPCHLHARPSLSPTH